MRPFLLTLIGIFLITGCATYQSRVTPARQKIQMGQCEEGLPELEKLSQTPDGDQLVYLLEYATALQICKDYKKSNEVFLKADKLSEEIDYHSATRVVGAALLNEEMIQYKGDSFEKLFINAMSALNYIQLGQLDEALVEVRRINEKFKKMNSDDKKKFELNSFSQYLSGLIWEMDQKYDDACISYKAAYKLDPKFRGVALDMLRGCWLAKRNQEFELLVKEVKPTDQELSLIRQKSKNEAVVIFLQGWGPQKRPRSDHPTFPMLSPVRSLTQSLQIQIKDKKYLTQAVYSVEQAAIDTLNDDVGSLIARRVGARVAKEVFADQLRQKDRALGEVARLIMLVSEKADLRQWSMLPQTIQVLRLPVSNDDSISIFGVDYSGQTTEIFSNLDWNKIKKNKFLLVRSLK